MKKIKLILKLLNEKERKSLYFLTFLMILGALLETIGIGLVIPAISVLIDGVDGILKFEIFNNFENDLNLFDDKQLAIIIFSILFLIFFIKSIFLVILYYFQYTFSSKLLARITKEMYEKIIHQPYYVFLQKNTSKYINTLSNETRLFVDLCIEPLLSFVTETIIFLFILIFLIIVEPIGTLLVVATLFIAVLIFYVLSRKKSRAWGIQRQESEEALIKSMQEPFHGIKEVKIFNITDYIFAIFENYLLQSTNARKKISVLLHLPRIWLEITAILTMTILVLFTLYFKKDIVNILPILAVFAAAAFRIIPSANRILISLQNVRYGFAAADVLFKHLDEIKKFSNIEKLNNNTKHINEFKSIKLNKINFSYKSNNVKIFENLNFEINQGDCVGIIGTTGSGKSTFIDLICGLLKPDKGDILVNNENLLGNEINWRYKIGYVPQNYYLLDKSIKENIAFGELNEEINIKNLNHAINYAQLDDFISSLESKLDTKVGERGIRLSGGQKQRLAIARALYFNPEIIIFDEATSSLDLETEENLLNTIKNLIGKKTLLIVSHRMNSLKNCNKIFRVENLNLKEVSKQKLNF
jgi:ABC-type multidrug transport system fused ATPase/permease subunit